MGAQFSDEEIKRLRDLLEVDEIKKLGTLYSQLMDHHYLDALVDLFTEDAICEFGPRGTWHGRSEIRANYPKVWESNGGLEFASMHANSHHWVELTGPKSAVGRRYLLDVTTRRPTAEVPFICFGLYDESYEKVTGAWKLARVSLQYFWPERQLTEGFPGQFPPGRPPS